MAEKDQQPSLPPATAETLTTAHDIESATVQSKELRRKKRMMCAAYVAAFITVQIIVLVAFELSVMRVRSPKYRLSSISIQTLSFSNSTSTSPSFDMRFEAKVTVKNTNFGPYKFEDGNITMSYRGDKVGVVLITSASAGTLSSKRMSVSVDVSSGSVSNGSDLRSDIASGMLTLNGESKLTGKVVLMKAIDKKKSTKMKCAMTVNLASKVVQVLKC